MSTSPYYRVVEPHPTPSTSARPSFHTGRGGTGNIVHLTSTSSVTSGPNASGPASLTTLHAHIPKTFKTGRGGAGNVHPASERAIFSFDEELERQMRRESTVAPVYHVGRGGAGNLVTGNYQSSRKGSVIREDETASLGSAESNGSAADGVAHRARRSLEKGWGRIVGVGH